MTALWAGLAIFGVVAGLLVSAVLLRLAYLRFRLATNLRPLAARLLKAHGYRAHQRKKLSIRRRHQRQMVTGLVVNERVRLPRETRRRLRAVQHRLRTGKPATMT